MAHNYNLSYMCYTRFNLGVQMRDKRLKRCDIFFLMIFIIHLIKEISRTFSVAICGGNNEKYIIADALLFRQWIFSYVGGNFFPDRKRHRDRFNSNDADDMGPFKKGIERCPCLLTENKW